MIVATTGGVTVSVVELGDTPLILAVIVGQVSMAHPKLDTPWGPFQLLCQLALRQQNLFSWRFAYFAVLRLFRQHVGI